MLRRLADHLGERPERLRVGAARAYVERLREETPERRRAEVLLRDVERVEAVAVEPRGEVAEQEGLPGAGEADEQAVEGPGFQRGRELARGAGEVGEGEEVAGDPARRGTLLPGGVGRGGGVRHGILRLHGLASGELGSRARSMALR